MESNVEEITASLVREYLSRKGLKATLAALDDELPRTEQSISNPAVLARATRIESLLKKDKIELKDCYRTLLEILVEHTVSNPIDVHSSLIHQKPSHKKNGKPISYNPLHTGPYPSDRTHKVTSTGLVASKKHTSMTASRGLLKDTKGIITLSETTKPMSHDKKTHDHHKTVEIVSLSKPPPLPLEEGELQFEDIEDVVVESTTTTPIVITTSVKGVPIAIQTAQFLRELVFGTALGSSFNDEWRMQGFTFQSTPLLTYGLIQHKGGPCGILACVQAYILKHILFTNHSVNEAVPELSPSQQTESLVNAISCILWKVRHTTVTVSLKSYSKRQQQFGGIPHYSPDGITENLLLYEFSQYLALKDFINSHIRSFTSDDSAGAILLLYSIILSHTMEKIRCEMDEPSNHLIGSHGYCSQELVNLILSGIASSNVFDGHTSLVIDGPTLKGVSSPCEIGYLTLFEHYGVCQVGDYYKRPLLPIWIVCSESHYSVLFGLSRDIADIKKPLSKFTLHYYDGLAYLTEPVILDIISDGKITEDSRELVPPLELIIKTRWLKCSAVNWNCEPLL